MATLHPDIILYQPSSLPYGGEWKGRDGFGKWLDMFIMTWMNIVPTDAEFYPIGSEMLISTVTMHAASRETGIEIEMPMCQIIHFADDMPIKWRNFAWDTAAMLNTLRS